MLRYMVKAELSCKSADIKRDFPGSSRWAECSHQGQSKGKREGGTELGGWDDRSQTHSHTAGFEMRKEAINHGIWTAPRS